MFRQILIVFSAMVFSSIAEIDFHKERRQNFNNNNNYNELYGGYESGLGLNSGGDRDFHKPRYPSSGTGSGHGRDLKEYQIPESVNEFRGSNLPKYSPNGSGRINHKLTKYSANDNEYKGNNLIKYPVTGREFVEDKSQSDNRYGGGYGRDSCNAILDGLFRDNEDEQAVVDEPAYDDGSPEGSANYNSNYNVVFRDSSRRHLGYRPSRSGSNSWRSNNVNSNINSNSIGSNYRRSYNWRTVRPSSGRNFDYNRDDNRGYGKINQYNKDNLFPYESEENYDRDIEDYDRKSRSSNVNSNSNFNVLNGRRGNVNYNTNTNDFGYGDYDESHEDERSETIPKYSNYHKRRSGYDDYEMQGNYDDYSTNGYPWIDYTQKPSYLYENKDDSEEEEDPPQYEGQSQNTNVNSNSNVNFFSRRSNRNSNGNKNSFLKRHKRSADKFENLSKSVDKKKKGETSILSKTESTTTSKSIAEKWENPRNSIYH